MDLNSVSLEINIPSAILEGIWTNASRLLSTINAIVPAPSQSPEARMVLSYSGKTPHMVLSKKKKGDFSCDSNCPNYKALAICSHVVAVAEINGQLSDFIAAVKRRKPQPNVTRLVTTNMPKGRGRKGGVAPRSRRPQQLETTLIEMNTSSGSGLDIAKTLPMTSNVDTPLTPNVGIAMPSNVASVCQSPFVGYLSIHQHQPYSSLPNRPMMGPNPAFHYSPTGYSYTSCGTSLYPPRSPFVLCFISGNISVCCGCKNKCHKSAMEPPDDLWNPQMIFVFDIKIGESMFH